MRWIVPLLGFLCQLAGTLSIISALVMFSLLRTVPQPASAANAYYFVAAFLVMGILLIALGKRTRRLRANRSD